MTSTDINTLYQRFIEESVSCSQIYLWLMQFDSSDQPTVSSLAEVIGDINVYARIAYLYTRLMKQLSLRDEVFTPFQMFIV